MRFSENQVGHMEIVGRNGLSFAILGSHGFIRKKVGQDACLNLGLLRSQPQVRRRQSRDPKKVVNVPAGDEPGQDPKCKRPGAGLGHVLAMHSEK